MINDFTRSTGPESSSFTEIKPLLSAGRKVIVVLGMHRSGTSALAGTLHHLGVDLGKSLMPADEKFNPKGFWENEKIVEIHQRILQDLDYAWCDVRLLPDNWLTRKTVREKKNAMIKIIAKEFGNNQVWGIKDPRICRLLPLWKQIFSELGLHAVYVHIFRNPLEVAVSLRRREGFVSAYSWLLWFLHNIEAVQNTSGDPRVFLGYEELLQDWRGAIETLGRKLDVRWPNEIAEAATEIDRFLSPDLYHNKNDHNALIRPEGISNYVTTLYNLLRGASASGAATAAEQFDDFSKDYMDAVNLFKPWQSIREEITTEGTAQIDGLDAGLAKRRQLIEERNNYIRLLEPALEEAQRIVQRQNGRIENLERALEDIQQNFARFALERMQRVELLEEKLEETKQLAIERITQIDVLDNGLAEAQRLVEERNKYVALLEPALEEAQRIVQEQNDKIEKLDAGLSETQRLVEERNSYVGILESALREAQQVVLDQTEKLNRLDRLPFWKSGRLRNEP